MTRTCALLLAVALFAGCAQNLSSVRTLEPRNRSEFPIEYRALALCTLDALDSRTSANSWGASPTLNRFLDREPGQSSEIVGWAGMGAWAPLFEVRFTKTAPTGTTVELRTAHDSDGAMTDRVWPIVTECATSATKARR